MKPTIKQLRIRKGWSVVQLAFSAKVSVPTIYRIERGLPVSELMISRVCIALGTSIDDVDVNIKE